MEIRRLVAENYTHFWLCNGLFAVGDIRSSIDSLMQVHGINYALPDCKSINKSKIIVRFI